MTKQEFALFAMALKTYYPKEQLLPNEQAMELWYRQVKDIPYAIAEMALQKWVSSNKWSPTICELKSKIGSIHWEAYEAIRMRESYGAGSEEELKQYRWIYEVTQEYRNQKFVEPSVHQMLTGGQHLQIGAGRND